MSCQPKTHGEEGHHGNQSINQTNTNTLGDPGPSLLRGQEGILTPDSKVEGSQALPFREAESVFVDIFPKLPIFDFYST